MKMAHLKIKLLFFIILIISNTYCQNKYPNLKISDNLYNKKFEIKIDSNSTLMPYVNLLTVDSIRTNLKIDKLLFNVLPKFVDLNSCFYFKNPKNSFKIVLDTLADMFVLYFDNTSCDTLFFNF